MSILIQKRIAYALVPAMAIIGYTGFINPVFAQEKIKTISLNQAIEQALEKSPSLGAAASRSEAARAGVSEAGALPNPEISIEAENIYGSDQFKNMKSAEMTYGISQLVELPGKRGSRIDISEAEKYKMAYLNDAARLDVVKDVTIAYFELAIAQRNLSVIQDGHELAQNMRDSVAAKVSAGKEPPIQKNKADIELSSSTIKLEQVRRAVNTKEQALANLLGGGADPIAVDAQDLLTLNEPQPFAFYQQSLMNTPDFKSADADVFRAESQLSLEKANAIPDPVLGFGIRQFREDDSRAFVAQVSFPIPVFNMNRAAIQRTGHELNASKYEQRASRLAFETSLADAYANLVNAYSEAKILRDAILPGAEEAFSFSQQGYDAGKFEYIEALDAQRTLFEARKQYNDSLLNYHQQLAVIERMTAAYFYKNTNNQ